ncbi:UNVERIFIED_CONTAM: hypothetical protein K2H54_051792 [Gekko kuhli]
METEVRNESITPSNSEGWMDAHQETAKRGHSQMRQEILFLISFCICKNITNIFLRQGKSLRSSLRWTELAHCLKEVKGWNFKKGGKNLRAGEMGCLKPLTAYASWRDVNNEFLLPKLLGLG